MDKKPLLTLLIIIVLVGAWWFVSKQKISNSNPSLNNFSPIGNTIENKDTAALNSIKFDDIKLDTSTWLNYKNSEEKYSLKYPSTWKAEDLSSTQNKESTYSNVISVYANSNLPLDKNYRSVTIRCCSLPKTAASLQSALQSTTLDKISMQELKVNNNKVIILNTGSLDNAGEVFVYVISKDKMFEFNVNAPDGYNKDAYITTVGIVRNFSASQ